MLYTEAVDRLQALGAELPTAPGQPRRKFELAQMRTLMAALGVRSQVSDHLIDRLVQARWRSIAGCWRSTSRRPR